MSRRTQADRLVDFVRLLKDLGAAGLCGAEVSRRLHVNPSTLQYWKSGGEPRYSDGVRLLDLCRESQESAYGSE